jgi:hypothetical protein
VALNFFKRIALSVRRAALEQGQQVWRGWCGEAE